jgi:hypothetical protein
LDNTGKVFILCIFNKNSQMLTRVELLDWFGDLGLIITDINISIDNIQRIIQPVSENEKKILSIGFFDQFYHQSRFVTIVQLCKVFQKNINQKRNFHDLFDRLYSDMYDRAIEFLLTTNGSGQQLTSARDDLKSTIDSFRREIKTHKKLLKKVIDSRNKLYAHTDPNCKVPLVTDDELDILVKLSNKIYNELHSKIFVFRMGFEYTQDWRIDDILTVLSKFKLEEIEKREHRPIIKAVSGTISDQSVNDNGQAQTC